MTSPMPDAMRWPGIRRKVWPITVVRVPGWGFGICGPAEYYGAWCILSIGPWRAFFGSGTYDHA